MNKRNELVYISHPYGGDDGNLRKTETDVTYYRAKNQHTLPISPVLMWRKLYYMLPYEDGLEMCLDLLSRCDRLYLCKGWQASRGCMAEWAFAVAKGIPIEYEEGEDDEV